MWRHSNGSKENRGTARNKLRRRQFTTPTHGVLLLEYFSFVFLSSFFPAPYSIYISCQTICAHWIALPTKQANINCSRPSCLVCYNATLRSTIPVVLSLTATAPTCHCTLAHSTTWNGNSPCHWRRYGFSAFYSSKKEKVCVYCGCSTEWHAKGKQIGYA
jgi:hypothetical protein